MDEFANLDDYDIMTSVKVWQNHSDKILSKLCKMMVNRNLYKVVINDTRLAKDELNAIKEKFSKQLKISEKEIEYFVFQDAIENNAYNPKMDKINILLKNNTVKDISEAADTLNITALARPVKKWFVCYPKK